MFNLTLDWQDYMIQLVTYAGIKFHLCRFRNKNSCSFSNFLSIKGENPWNFLYYTLLLLSPLFGISAYLSYRLIQEIDKKEKETKKRQIKNANKVKVTKKRD
jgi:hypothetical protein